MFSFSKEVYLWLVYRYRFLALYIVFGLLSLLLEGLINILLIGFVPPLLTSLISLFSGVFLAFFLNISFNFKISKPKRNKALVYFLIISIISFILQTTFRNVLFLQTSFGLNEFAKRLLFSGLFFFFGYVLHLKYSFRDQKKVGVAIYANGVEDIANIYSRISSLPDFIHVDIVDHTFNPSTDDVSAHRLEVVRAYWPNKSIELHVMSRNPLKWIKECVNYIDKTFVHYDIDDNFGDIVQVLRERNILVGLVVDMDSEVSEVKVLIEKYNITEVMILAIDQPGFSGQSFNPKAFNVISEFNSFSSRDNLLLTIDGGVNADNISRLSVERVVSGSFVLNAHDPIKKIVELQTSGQY